MKPILLAMILLAGGAAAGDDAPDGAVFTLKVRPQVVLRGDTVLLGDVLVLGTVDAALRGKIEQAPLNTGLRAPTRVRVGHDQINKRLDELGVNRGRVLLGGAIECDVTLEKPITAGGARSDDGNNEVNEGTLVRTKSAGGAQTLAQAVREQVTREFAKEGGSPEIEFERAGQDVLELTTPPWDFSISAGRSGDRLGLREFAVAIRREGVAQRTVRVYGQVRLVRKVAIARKPLNVGTTVRRDDVELQTRVFERGDDLGLAAIEAVIGQQVKTFVAPGDMVRAACLKTVDLVQRGRPITIVGSTKGVQIRLSGTALGSGAYGDSIRVMIGEPGRKRPQELRGVITGPGTVRIAEEDLDSAR